jgi:hypothetical protein
MVEGRKNMELTIIFRSVYMSKTIKINKKYWEELIAYFPFTTFFEYLI